MLRLLSLLAMVVLVLAPVTAAAIVADHTVVPLFESLPDTTVVRAMNHFRMFYGHTSHGSQIVTGMDMVRDEYPLFDFNNGPGTFQFSEYGSDLGHTGDTTWVAVTRSVLDQPGNDINLVMWSWCGGCSDNTEAGINVYLDAMDRLEQRYPLVRFVYMTGHLDGTGPSGILYTRNNQIRTYCAAHDKVLFDFADVESYDPNGTWYPWESDGCAWCAAWCASHGCPGCPSCAHSHCYNCYRKGKAFWWMLAAMTPGTGVGDAEVVGPTLAQSAPNPFSPETSISFTMPSAGRATVAVYTLAGREVARLVDGVLGAGEHTVVWDGRRADGSQAAAGVYFLRLAAAGKELTTKSVLIR